MQGKKIILGVCGGIAAYKAVDLVSHLRKEGAEVHVVLTKNAAKFVSTLSLQVMSNNKVFSQESLTNQEQIDHIALADKADLVLIAPATADAMAKLVTGISDEILYDLVLATKAPILLAPAMNTNMWEHPTTKRNFHVLKESLEYKFIEPESGALACGHIGQGRLAETNVILEKVREVLGSSVIARSPKGDEAIQTSKKMDCFADARNDESLSADVNQVIPPSNVEDEEENLNLPSIPNLRNKKIVITVGATREKIDPIRYITNKSSGKMGFCLAREAVRQGAKVTLISTLDLTESWAKDLNLIRVETCEEMYNAVFNEFAKSTLFTAAADALIMVAAVADYRPKNPSNTKLKKSNEENQGSNSTISAIVNLINQANDRVGDLSIELEKTPDILQEVSRVKSENQILIGFSVETENAIENARHKVREKDLDFIVVNNPEAFASEQAEVTIVGSEKQSAAIPMITTLPKQSKKEIAHQVLNSLGKCLQASLRASEGGVAI